MNFFELSHAPPALDIMIASMAPLAMAQDSIATRQHHLFNGYSSTDSHTGVVIGVVLVLHDSRDSGELTANFFNDSPSGLADTEHSQRSEEIGQHTTEKDTGEHNGVTNVHDSYTSLVEEGGKKRHRGHHGGPDGKALASGGSSVTKSI